MLRKSHHTFIPLISGKSSIHFTAKSFDLPYFTVNLEDSIVPAVVSADSLLALGHLKGIFFIISADMYNKNSQIQHKQQQPTNLRLKIICSGLFVWPYAHLLTALHYMWRTSRLLPWTGYSPTHTWEKIRSLAVVTLITQSFATLDSLHNCFTIPVSWVSSGIMGQGLSFV